MKEGRFPAIVTKHFFDKVGKRETEVIRFTNRDRDWETKAKLKPTRSFFARS